MSGDRDARCSECRATASWSWRENEEDTLLCETHMLAALELLIISRDGSVKWVVPRIREKGAHPGPELFGMLTVTS